MSAPVLERSPLACATCGKDVRSTAWVACAWCTARAHEACWREKGCASCGSSQVLPDAAASVAGQVARPARRLPDRARVRDALVKGTFALVYFLLLTAGEAEAGCSGVLLAAVLGVPVARAASALVGRLGDALYRALDRVKPPAATSPLVADAIRLRAEEHAARGESARAIELFFEIVARDPSDARARRRLRELGAPAGRAASSAAS